MKITSAQVKAVGEEILLVASAFDPRDAAIVKGLLEAATKMNDMIHAIKTQDAGNKGDVWNQISNNYSEALDKYHESLDKHAPA